ncbi:MAG: T9SS type A sorting domain-containing protein, partial [Bacteroidota bacterium]
VDNTPPVISNCQPISPVVTASPTCTFNGNPGTFFVEENCPAGLQIIERYFDENGNNYLTLTFNEFLGPRTLGDFRNLPIGQNTVELTLRDASGNTDDCSFNITVVSNIVLPEPPAPLSFQCIDEVPEPITLSAEDDCFGTITGVVSESDNGGSGCLGDPLVIQRTWTFDNGSDNVNQVSRMITVEDTEAPEFDLTCQVDLTFFTEAGDVCPADATISLNEGDELTIFDDWTVGGNAIFPLEGCVMDNCTDDSDLTITVDDITVVDDGTCSRTITVTFVADDGCGNFSDPFVCNYTFIDNTGPAVSFNGIPDGGTYVVECDLPSEDWDPLTDIGELTITDNCSEIESVTEVLTQLYDGPCTDNVLTRWEQQFTVVDVCGNTTIYTLFTEIIDNTAPVFTSSPADVTIECDEVAPTPELEAMDACSEVVYNFQEVRIDGDCPNSYTLQRTWTAADGCGNASQEVQIVTVEDTTPPEIEFVDGFINTYDLNQDVYISCSEIDNILAIITNAASASDNCGDVELGYELTDLGFFDCLEYGYVGAYISRWKAVDACGNATEATLNWFLVDDTAPVLLNVPDDTCADANDLPPVASVEARDECEFAELSFDESDPIDCEGGQYIERTWTATDLCGNTATATQTIVLSGADAAVINIDYPGIESVQNGDTVELPLDCGQSLAQTIAELEAAISVNGGCGGVESSVALTLVGESSCEDEGYITRYELDIMANDPCSGELANLLVTIDFVDQTGPVVDALPAIIINCVDEIPLPAASDACGGDLMVTFTDESPILTSCPADPVAYPRTWTVSDACGNATTFVQNITILDKEGPTFSNVPADACNDTSFDADAVTAFDACSGSDTEVSFSETTISTDDCGEVLTRTWTATDDCGNSNIAVQQVFVADNTAPELAFNNGLLLGLDNGDELFLSIGSGVGSPNDPLLFTATDVAATDNCSSVNIEVMMESKDAEDCATDGFVTRYDYVFTATDACGNTDNLKLTVYYLDEYGPDIFNVPADETVICEAIPAVGEVFVQDDFDEEVEVVFSETQTPTDNGLLITRTWTATDDCGNTNSASQEITVIDNDLSAEFTLLDSEVDCNTDNNRLLLNVSGGMPPYSYAWTLTDPLEDGFITSDPTRRGIRFTMGYITQTFTVVITDANGCQLTASTTVKCDFSDDEGDFLIGGGNSGGSSSEYFEVNTYPNPTSESLRVTFGNSREAAATVGLYSLFGQELFLQSYQSWPQEGVDIDTRQLPNGTYLLRIEREGQAPVSREIVVLH